MVYDEIHIKVLLINMADWQNYRPSLLKPFQNILRYWNSLKLQTGVLWEIISKTEKKEI